MNGFIAAVIYTVIGGLLAAALINAKAKDCGPLKVETSEVMEIALGWPAMIVAAIAIDDGALKNSECPAKDEEKK